MVERYLKELEKLNKQQRAAVESEDKYVLLNAAVGSGKTTVLIHKVLYLHIIKKIPLEEMVVLTFTKKAAEEIKGRILAFDDALENKMKYFGTFHSVSRTILDEHAGLVETGWQSGFSIIDNEEAGDLLLEIIEKRSLKIKYKSKLIKRIEEFKNGKALYGVMKHQDDIEELIRYYISEKKLRNVMDFEDVIDNCIEVLNAPLDVRWMIVDEFQDTDIRQLELIRRVINPDTNILCIGDENQIIYSWRTGVEDIFGEFKRIFKPKLMKLPLNYRSSKTIIDAANALLFSNNIEGIKEYGTPIIVEKYYDAFNEALQIARKVKELHETGIPLRDMAVLYRRQSQLEVLHDVLGSEDIPCNILFKKKLSFEDMDENFTGENDSLNLLTLHGSKGLEFSHVFIIGANMGNIPISSRRNEETEEIRLFYVGITRAREFLQISYLVKPTIQGILPYPSPYISMIPSKLVEREDEDRTNRLSELMKALRQERSKEKNYQVKRAKHLKYGSGIITYEDDNIIRAKFEDYGEKEFSKMFCPLEIEQ